SETVTTRVEPTWLMRTSENMPVPNSALTPLSTSVLEKDWPGLIPTWLRIVSASTREFPRTSILLTTAASATDTATSCTASADGTPSAADKAAADAALLTSDAAIIGLKNLFLEVPTARK